MVSQNSPFDADSSDESLSLVRNLLDSSTEFSFVGIDGDEKISFWNEGARRLYGYEAAEVVGTAASSILHTADDIRAGKPSQIFQSAQKNGKWEGVVQRRRKNGQQFAANVVVTPRRHPSGRNVGYVLISKDVSADLRVNEQLRATQFYTRSLIESNIDALMTTDPLGIITDVNQQMESLTGLHPRAIDRLAVSFVLHRFKSGRRRHSPGASGWSGHEL